MTRGAMNRGRRRAVARPRLRWRSAIRAAAIVASGLLVLRSLWTRSQWEETEALRRRYESRAESWGGPARTEGRSSSERPKPTRQDGHKSGGLEGADRVVRAVRSVGDVPSRSPSGASRDSGESADSSDSSDALTQPPAIEFFPVESVVRREAKRSVGSAGPDWTIVGWIEAGPVTRICLATDPQPVWVSEGDRIAGWELLHVTRNALIWMAPNERRSHRTVIERGRHEK